MKERRDPESAGDILARLKQTSSLGPIFIQSRIWENWPAIAGPSLAVHGHPVRIREGTLTIAADSAVWVHKFGLKKWQIILRANRFAGRELVSDIFIELAGDPEVTPEK